MNAISGMIFDLKEYAVNDGPGGRVTVFFKGCPLRCAWCHNPEGWKFEPEPNRKTGALCGKAWSPEELTAQLRKFRDFYEISGGGVTFSGGEPLAQPEFLGACLDKLDGIHVTLDTSGFAEPEVFDRFLDRIDLYYFDLKLAGEAKHRQWTGQSNAKILRNLRQASARGKAIVIRIPVIPGVNDDAEELTAMAEVIRTLPNPPERIDLLPFHLLAGSKYENFGYVFPEEKFGKTIAVENLRRFRQSLLPLETVYYGKESLC